MSKEIKPWKLRKEREIAAICRNLKVTQRPLFLSVRVGDKIKSRDITALH